MANCPASPSTRRPIASAPATPPRVRAVSPSPAPAASPARAKTAEPAAPYLLSLPDDLTWLAVGELLGDIPFSPHLKTLTTTCRGFRDHRVAMVARAAREAAKAARAALRKRSVLLVAHTKARWPPGRGALVDLRQNFLMYVTPTTPLASLYSAMDKRLRVSASATTQTKRRRPCGQSIAVGYTSARTTKLRLTDRRTGAVLGTAGDAGDLVAGARPLDGAGTLAVHVDLELVRDAHLAGAEPDAEDLWEADAPTA